MYASQKYAIIMLLGKWSAVHARIQYVKRKGPITFILSSVNVKFSNIKMLLKLI